MEVERFGRLGIRSFWVLAAFWIVWGEGERREGGVVLSLSGTNFLQNVLTLISLAMISLTDMAVAP